MYSLAFAVWIFFFLVPLLSVTCALLVLIFLSVIFSFSLWKWLARPLEDRVEGGAGPGTAPPPAGRPGAGSGTAPD
jgi:membrane protein implicated in regulation of membrane protease activity